MDCRAHGPFRKLLSTLLSLLAPSACAHVEQDGENRKYLANSTRSFSFVSASGGALKAKIPSLEPLERERSPLDGGGGADSSLLPDVSCDVSSMSLLPGPPRCRGLNLIISGLTVIIIGQEETTTSDPSTATHFAFFGGKRFSYVRYPPTIAPPLVI
jgi:hypothetical protein